VPRFPGAASPRNPSNSQENTMTRTGSGAVFLAIALFVGAFFVGGISGAWDAAPHHDAVQRLAAAFEVDHPVYR
jgi:hypothetical protein